MMISPLLTKSMPPKRFNIVDFPAPLGPSITTNSPSFIEKLILLIALIFCSPKSYSLVTFLNSGNVKTREPKQKRSIEKKNKIIKAGFDLFCEKGYYNTNTAEIAKAAGVSTGIVYNYFKNKKDILIESLQYFSDSILIPMFDKLNSIDNLSDFSNLLNEIIDSLAESHIALKSAYKEMLAMSNLDEDVENFYKNCEITCINLIVSWLQKKTI